MAETTTLDLLKSQREAVAAKLRRISPELMQQLSALDSAIADLSVQAGGSHEYGKYKRAIDAVIAYLRERGQPLPPKEIVEGVLERGWLLGDPRRRTNVYDAIRLSIKRWKGKIRLVTKHKIDLGEWDVLIDDIPIGLCEWPDRK